MQTKKIYLTKVIRIFSDLAFGALTMLCSVVKNAGSG